MRSEETSTAPEPRKGMPDVHLDEAAFRERFLQQFADPRFAERARRRSTAIAGIAFRNYDDGRKAPNSRPAGPGYADPDYDLSRRLARGQGGDRPGAARI